MTRERLDQIYTTQKIADTAVDWEIDESGIETDHELVSVIITNPKAPFIGKGRWTLPLFLLKDKEFKKTAIDLSIKLQKDLEELPARDGTKNPQTIFLKYKDEIKETAIARAKITVPTKKKMIECLKGEKMKTENSSTLEDEEKIEESTLIGEKIQQAERQLLENAQITTKVQFNKKGEEIGMYWSNKTKM